MTNPTLVGVGGGAGGLARHVATRLGWPLSIPEHAEVISSIGDALSTIRAERERTVDTVDAATLEAIMAAVEAEVVAAGASPGSVEVRVEEVPERRLLRAIATGAVGLSAGATPGRAEATQDEIVSAAEPGAVVGRRGEFWLVRTDSRIAVLDRFGDEFLALQGEETTGADLTESIARHTRYRGPVTLRPTVWILDRLRVIELAATDCSRASLLGDHVTYLVGRQV